MSNTTFKKMGLILETSTDPAYLILTEKERVCAYLCIEEKNSLSSHLVERLDLFLSKEGCPLSSLSFLAASKGPGSYTSLRVGATVAKSLCYALKLPLISYCSLEMFTPPSAGSYLAAMDANTRGLYLLEGDVVGEKKPLLVPNDEARSFFEKVLFRLIPKKDPLAKKFPDVSFVESLLDFEKLSHHVYRSFTTSATNPLFPEISLLYL
jgi:tRNA threonylcarbamoyl adenosine modification protein YeaZ